MLFRCKYVGVELVELLSSVRLAMNVGLIGSYGHYVKDEDGLI